MNVFEKTIVILSKLSNTGEISSNHKLRDDLALDSLQMVTLLVMLEDTFDILLNESDMNPFDLVNVQDVVNLVKKYVEGENHEEKKEG